MSAQERLARVLKSSAGWGDDTIKEVLESFADEVQIKNDEPFLPLPPPPTAVVYELEDGSYHEANLPPGAAVIHHPGGILVSHEAAAVKRILSVRPIFPGEGTDAPEADEGDQDR